jgi:DNA-binding IclR family transcriptional regulator
MRLPVHNGSRMSATRTTVGKALLAHQPAELVERIAAAEHPDWSAEGFELRALMADLRKVRETGFASFASTASSEPTCVATPLRVGQTVIGAIALSGPPAQFSINSVSQALRAAAQVIAGDYAAHTERAAALRQ